MGLGFRDIHIYKHIRIHIHIHNIFTHTHTHKHTHTYLVVALAHVLLYHGLLHGLFLPFPGTHRLFLYTSTRIPRRACRTSSSATRRNSRRLLNANRRNRLNRRSPGTRLAWNAKCRSQCAVVCAT